jgi:hypothetical protein
VTKNLLKVVCIIRLTGLAMHCSKVFTLGDGDSRKDETGKVSLWRILIVFSI